MLPEQQLARLHKLAKLSWLPKGMLVLTIFFVVLAFFTDYEIFFVLSVFTGLATVAAREAAPHLRNAIRAVEEGSSSKGKVSIKVNKDDDAPEYQAIVQGTHKETWSFQFSPHKWLPIEGSFKADIIYVSGVEWPALLITQKGILFPSFKPQNLRHPS